MTLDKVFEFIPKLGGLAGILAFLTIAWQWWYASQFNELEVLIAGNEWRKKRDLCLTLFVYLVLLLINVSISFSSYGFSKQIFFVIAIIAYVIGIAYGFKYLKDKNIKSGNKFSGFLFGTGVMLCCLLAQHIYDKVLKESDGTIKTENLLKYMGLIALITLAEGLFTLLILRTVSTKKRIMLQLRKYNSSDKELYVYRRIGDDLICGDNEDIYKANDIITVPVPDVKEKQYSFSYIKNSLTNDSSNNGGNDPSSTDSSGVQAAESTFQNPDNEEQSS